ncbi:MAG: N5-glutamine methyltransferase family protein [Candidatus Saccharimonadales bacterium]
MTIANWLIDSMIRLQQADIPNGRTDALVLLADLFGKDKSWVHTHPEHVLDDLQIRELEYKLTKRLSHTPLAYIRGFKDFYGRRFMVNSRVLVPRPESESFIELVKTTDLEMPRIADIGTGSGCLGVTVALEIPEATVHLYDIDADALGVANHNAEQYGLRLEYYLSDLLTDLAGGPYQILLANLPYVPQNLVTSPEIEQEPALALFSGLDGLNHYRIFWKQVRALRPKPRYVLTESLEKQHGSVETLAKNAGYKLMRSDVLVQLYTINKGRTP